MTIDNIHIPEWILTFEKIFLKDKLKKEKNEISSSNQDWESNPD